MVESEIEGEFVSDGNELSFPNDNRVQALIIKIINFTFLMTFMVWLLWRKKTSGCFIEWICSQDLKAEITPSLIDSLNR